MAGWSENLNGDGKMAGKLNMNRINLKNGLTLFTAFWICVSLAFGITDDELNFRAERHSEQNHAYHNSPIGKAERQAQAAREAARSEDNSLKNLKHRELSDYFFAIGVREYLDILADLETARLKANSSPSEKNYKKEMSLLKRLQESESNLGRKGKREVLQRLNKSLYMNYSFSIDLSDLNKASHIYGAIKRLQSAE